MLNSLLRILVPCGLVFGVIGEPFAEAQWVNKPTQDLLERTPGLIHETFESDSMRITVGYSVVLPPSYNDNNDRRYPVVYWLHGGGGNECSSLYTSYAWTDLYKSAKAREVILVYPNGFRSGYMDHQNGNVMVESMVIRELIPRIDQRYRTIASGFGRAVHGFSMGASGALKFVIKYPELFCAAVAYGGGSVDLERSDSPFILSILEKNLGSDPGRIRENNTYHFLDKNHARIRQNGIRVMLVCGEGDSWMESAESFQTALRDKNIVCELRRVPDTGHNLRKLSSVEGSAAANFQDVAFREALKTSGATFDDAYFSQAEGRWQRFQVCLPVGFSLNETYPMLVQVHGSRTLLPSRAYPFIRVRPNGLGVWGYRSMSRYDVMQVLRHMKDAFNIDEDRVYMTGRSAGATGIMHTAAYRPDLFAGVVPLVAFGNDLPLENFRNLPIRCEHGVDDWTSAIGNVRVQFEKLGTLRYDAVLNEHPRKGHGIGGPPHETMQWLFNCKRNASPNHIVYSCEHPRDGRAYWLRIESLLDPHQIARIDAGVGAGGCRVTTQNVRRFSLDPSAMPDSPNWKLTVDQRPVDVSKARPHDKWTVIKENGNWQMAPIRGDHAGGKRAYGAGAAANFFQGEPLLVVHGTGASKNENRFLRQAAEILARSGGPDHGPANVRFPVCADSNLSDFRIEKYNLLLVGTPQNNEWLREIAASLPYSVDNGVLSAGNRKPLPLRGSVLSFHFYNPMYPERIIYLVSPYLDEVEQERFLENPRVFLAGSAGFKMIDQPDLVVRGADLRLRREMQLDADWRFIHYKGENQRVPQRFTERVQLALAHMKVMHRTAAADFALWWGPTDQGLFGGYDFNWLPTLDPESYTMADYAVRRRETESMTGVISGDELTDILDRWIVKGELVAWPSLNRQEIESDRRYRIVIPMDLVAKLGNRRKVLSAVAPGPDIMPAHVAAEIFAAKD